MTHRIHPTHKTLRDNDRRFRFLYHRKTMNRLSCTEIASIVNFGLFNSFQICIKNLSETNRLSTKQIVAIEDPTNTVYVSSIVITAIVIKASLGKLELGFDPIDAVERGGFEVLDFSA